MDMSILNNNIINNISSIPGILGFCNIDESHKELKDSKLWEKALFLNIIDEKVSLNIAIIISIDSRINNIYKQIKEQLSFDFKKNGLKFMKLNIYIKGVR